MDNLEIELLKLFPPVGDLSLGILHTIQPFQGYMVSMKLESVSQKVWTKVDSDGHHSKQFISCSTVVSALDKRQLPYAITRSLPWLSSCDNTAPIPSLLASVSRMKGCVKSG